MSRKRPISDDTLFTDDDRCPASAPHDKGHKTQPNRCNLHDWVSRPWLHNLVEAMAE